LGGGKEMISEFFNEMKNEEALAPILSSQKHLFTSEP
jgi:hypothetical protein